MPQTFLRLTAMAIAGWPVLAMADAGRGAADSDPRPLQHDSLQTLRWKARPVIVLGDEAQVRQQVASLHARPPALTDRDIIVFVDGPGAEPLRDRAGNGFAVLLVGKDGGVKRIWNQPVDPQDIFAVIDAMPMRQREADQDG